MRADWLDQLWPDEIARLGHESTRRRCEAGELVFTPSAVVDSVFYLVRGLVRIFRVSASGRVATLGYVFAGEVFGELSTLIGGERQSYAEAVSTSNVLSIMRTTFEALVESHPSILAEVSRQLAARLKRLENRCEDLILCDTSQRLSHFLLQLGVDLGQVTPAGTTIPLRISQQDLATVIGATRQSVNLCLRDWKTAGVIEYGRGRLTILRPEALGTGRERRRS